MCLAFLRTDSEAEVIDILNAAGLWENKRVWRLYGDRVNNFSAIGNQRTHGSSHFSRFTFTLGVFFHLFRKEL